MALAQDEVFGIENDGRGIANDSLRSIFDLKPQGGQAAMISHFGEGLKMVSFALTRQDGLPLFFIRHHGSRAVIALGSDNHGAGPVQTRCIVFPDDWVANPADSKKSQREFVGRYAEEGNTDLDATIQHFCSQSKTTRAGSSGNPRAPYPVLNNVAEVRRMVLLGAIGSYERAEITS